MICAEGAAVVKGQGIRRHAKHETPVVVSNYKVEL
jgi:hypothetical protein